MSLTRSDLASVSSDRFTVNEQAPGGAVDAWPRHRQKQTIEEARMTTGTYVSGAGQPNGAQEQAQDKAQEMADQAQQKAHEAAGQAKSKLRDQLEQRSSQAAEQINQQASDLRSVGDSLREQ